MTITDKGIPLLDGGSDQPGTDDFADVADINAAFRKIDGLVGVTICTSLTKPSEPVKGQLILEVDTGAFSVYNSAISDWVLLSNPTANVPVGSILTYAGATPPTSYLFAEGDSLLKSVYPALFTAIGTQYGSASSLHFNAPNLKGRTVFGLDTTQTEFNVLGKTGGEVKHLLTVNEMPAHSHSQNPHSHAQNVSANFGGTAQRKDYQSDGAGGVYAQGISTDATTATNNNTGGGAAHYVLPPFAAMRYIIKF